MPSDPMSDHTSRQPTSEADTLRAQLINLTEACEGAIKRLQELERENESSAAQKRELERLRAAEQTAKERIEAEIEKSNAFARRAFELQKELQPLKEQFGMPVNEAHIGDTLRLRLPRLPQSLYEVVVPLLTVTDHLLKQESEWFLSEDGIQCLDQSVYGTMLPFGRLAQSRGATLTPRDLILVMTLQERMHVGLQALGFYVINPAIGDLFDQEQHQCPDSGLVWINDDASRHNRIASLKRIGYRDGNRVIRKAEVKRYLFQGAKEGVRSNRLPEPVWHAEPPVEEESATDDQAIEADLLEQTLHGNSEPR